MRNFWSTIGILALLAGCATSFSTHTVIESGNYAKAYSMVVNETKWMKNRQDVVQSIIKSTGGAKSDTYFKNVQTGIKLNTNKSVSFYLETLQHINTAPADGLLTQAQIKILHADLTENFEDAVIQDSTLIESKELLDAFGLNHDRGAFAQRTLERLIAGDNKDLNKYLAAYEVFKNGGDTARMNSAIFAMRDVIDENSLTLKGKRHDYSSVSVYVKYVLITGDHEKDSEIQDLINNSNITRANLDNFESVFPEYSKKQTEARLFKVDLKTNGDEFILSEIIDELQKINDWVEIDPDSSRKINFVRLRLNEQKTPPTNNTEIVPDPNFGTILMIPKNASVLFDYSASEYSIKWNFNIQDATTKKSKNIAGNKKLTKIECRNIRYQNVFGGVGSLNNFPNSRVQNFCQSSTEIDFDGARAETIRQIAQEVNENFIVQK